MPAVDTSDFFPFRDFVNLELPQRAAMLTIANTSYDGNPNSSVVPKINLAPAGTWFIQESTGDLWQKLIQSNPTSWVLRAGANSASGTLDVDKPNLILTAPADSPDSITGEMAVDSFTTLRDLIENLYNQAGIQIGNQNLPQLNHGQAADNSFDITTTTPTTIPVGSTTSHTCFDGEFLIEWDNSRTFVEYKAVLQLDNTIHFDVVYIGPSVPEVDIILNGTTVELSVTPTASFSNRYHGNFYVKGGI